MRERRWWLGCLAALVGVSGLSAQDCLPEDDHLEGLFGYAIDLATSSDELYAASRDTFNVPATTVSEVERVFDNAICKEAAKKYKQEFTVQGPAPDVYVVRVGERYLVTDPLTFMGEFSLYLVLDLGFNVMGSWAG